MSPHKGKKKIIRILSYLINNKVFITLIFSLFILLLTISIWLFFPVSSSGVHYYSIGLYALLVLGIIIFTSYKKDISIPIVKTVLKREYYRIKFKYNDIKKYFDFESGSNKIKYPIFIRIYLKILYYLIMLFKSSEDSFEVLKEDVFVEFSKSINNINENKKKQPIFVRIYLKIFRSSLSLFKSSDGNFDILKGDAFANLSESLDRVVENKPDDKFQRVKKIVNKIKFGEDVDEESLAELEKELFNFSKFKQKKATIFSLVAITALVVVTVISGLISSFLFPEVFKTRAASYGFVQTSWSGGAFADTAIHPGDETDWVKYFSKDNVSTSTPTELKLPLEAIEIWSETSDADFNTHATSSTYISSGSVGILKPNGAICSATIECSSGFCVDGVCCDTACTGSTCQTCGTLSNAGAGTCGYVNSSSEDPDSECAQGSAANDGCTDTTCSGSGYTCKAQTSGDGGCPLCGTCSDSDIACENHTANTYDSGCGQCTGCSGSEIGSCSTSQTTNWGANTHSCVASDKRCVSGTCRDCSDNGGYLYGDGCSGCAGQGGNACWYVGGDGTGDSCDTICASKGGCVAGGWNDSAASTVCYHYCGACNNHQSHTTNTAPQFNQNDPYYRCFYRQTGVTPDQSCSTTSSTSNNRLCVCLY